jgi:hypothetical protein
MVRKAALSLLISMLLFAVFTVFAFTGLFDLVDARFYNPAVARALDREIDADAQIIEEFFTELRIRFAATLDDGAVRRSLLADLESEDIVRRASLYGELLESLGGLQSVRLIDSGGRRIHFSTWQPDILRQDLGSVAYRNYDAVENSAAYIPYGQVETTVPRLILDGAGERIVFSHPFYDSYDVYRGTALFSLSVRAVIDRMVSAGRIKVGEDVSVVSEPPGLVVGLPVVGRNVLRPLIARIWSDNSLSLGALNSNLTGISLALISRRIDQNIFIGRLANQSLLSFPLAMRIILLVAFLITVFLIIFLVFNIRQDDVTIIQSRLKKLQVSLLEEYYEHTGDLNWSRWKRELEHRREDLHSELKRGLSAKTNSLPEIDNFIDRSWEELMAILGGHIERRSGIDEDALRSLLRRLPESTVAPSSPPKALDQAGVKETGEIEALNEADIVEALEGPADRKVNPTAPDPEFEELEELEAEELELAELEIVEPEESGDSAGAEAVETEPVEPVGEAPDPMSSGQGIDPPDLADRPETPDDPAEAELAEPDLPELETMELDLGEPEFEGPELTTDFQELDPVEVEDFDGSETIATNLASDIEFGPDSQELEQEKEEAARSMAEQFEIQSPFDSILSTLSEVEFAPEPMEELEALEGEWRTPDNSAEAEAEELRPGFAGPQFSVPFLETLSSEVALLTVEDEDEAEPVAPEETRERGMADTPAEPETGGIVTERDGVIYINESVLRPDKETLKGLDKNFKNLIDSILDNT